MKKVILLCLCFGLLSLSAQTLEWAYGIGGIGFDAALGIAVNDSGYTYTTGVFSGTIDFDPTPSTSMLTSKGHWDSFIQKLDQGGRFIWAKSIGGLAYESGEAITVDQSGNIYTTGVFEKTVDFDPNTGIYNLTSSGDYDIFIQKLDASGKLCWAKSMGGNDSDRGAAIALDSSGNIYTIGNFYGTVDFDPNMGVYNLTAEGFGFGGTDIFIQKLDSEGNFVWAKSMGSSLWESGNGIAVDKAGNVYTTGRFGGDVDFDPNVGILYVTTSGEYDAFILKLDTNGNFVWVRSIGAIENDEGRSIAVSDSGHVYTIGLFSEKVDFDPGFDTTYLDAQNGGSIFIQKLDTDGNFLWAKNIGGAGPDIGFSIAVDSAGGVYSIGGYEDTADFDPNDGVNHLTSQGESDIFIHKLDAGGNFCWVKSIGGTNRDLGYSIAVDNLGKVYATGYFDGRVDFDPNIGNHHLTTVGDEDIFVLKLNALGIVNLENNLQPSHLTLHPNPSNGLVYITLPEGAPQAHVHIANTLGQTVYQQFISPARNQLNLAHLPSGIYHVNMRLPSGVAYRGKVLLVR